MHFRDIELNNYKIENGFIKYPCGCQFKIKKERGNLFPLIYPGNPYKDWNYNCGLTLYLLSTGRTKGVFQLESGLGSTWCKELKPENTDHMAALASIVRPGVLEAKDEKGVSATKRYCQYKNGEAIPTYEIEAVGELLSNTYGLLIYQEQAILLAKELAGFDLQEADSLRKGIGKKLPEIIDSLRKTFVDGCKRVGKITEEEATKTFDMIEKSQRYAFNASHAYSYGILGQITAFAKAHFPEGFFTTYLEFAQDKSDPLLEQRELIEDAKHFDIVVIKPSIVDSKPHFSIKRPREILFGLNSIKAVGDSTIKKVKDYFETKKNVNWLDILVDCMYNINSKAAENIIKAGVVDTNISRRRQFHELGILFQLSGGEIKWLKENHTKYKSLKDAMIGLAKPKKEGGGLARKDRAEKVIGLIQTIDNPGYSLDDSSDWIATAEKEILGIALTKSVLDETINLQVNTTCKELLQDKNDYSMILSVEIENIEEKTIKNGTNAGKRFGKIDICDRTGMVKGCMSWPETYEKYGFLLVPGNTVSMEVYRNKNGGIVVKQVSQI